MSYAVSGGLGFIGKNLTPKILGDFIVLDRLAGCDLCKVDVKIPKCDTFIHLASLTNIRKSLSDPITFISENCSCTLKCLDFALNCDARFIFTSSMGAPHALSPYSASKLACEAYCTAYKESYGLDAKILRLSTVYGPHSTHKDSVVHTFIKQALSRRPLTIFGSGNQTRDFVYVDDVVNTILTAHEFVGFSNILVGSGEETSIVNLAKMIQDLSETLTNHRPIITYAPAIRGEVVFIDSESDIEPSISLEEGLDKTFRWYMENYEPTK